MKLCDFQVLQSRILQVLSGTALGERDSEWGRLEHATGDAIDEISEKSGKQLCKILEISGPSKKFDGSLIALQTRRAMTRYKQNVLPSLQLPGCINVRVIKRR